jgi:hypothetical protein
MDASKIVSHIALRCGSPFFSVAPGGTDYKELKSVRQGELPKNPANSHVKPQNRKTPYQPTTYRWHLS